MPTYSYEMPRAEPELLRLRQLEAFIAATKHDSFVKAAEELGISGSALSQIIGELEGDLGEGVRLFDRNQRGARPTRAGQAFIEFAQRILDEAAAGRRVVQAISGDTGGVLVSFVPSVRRYVVPALQSALRRTPRLHVTAREAESGRAYAHVSRGSAELGVTFFPPAGQAPEGYDLDPIVEGTFWCVTSADHPLAGRPSVTPADLKNERLAIPWVHAADERSWLGASFVSYSQAHEMWSPWPEFQANSIATVLQMVKQGLLVAVMPMLDSEDRKDVAVMPLDPPPPRVQLGFVWKGGQDRSTVAQAFAADVAKRIKKGFGDTAPAK